MSARYTSTAKWFHWLIVLLVGLELLLGVLLPSIRHNPTPDTLISLHLSFGITIIVVMVLRLLWRVTHRPPALPPGAWWEHLAAHGMHWLLYILLFIIPFCGWAWANAVGWSVVVFWLIPLPALVPMGWAYTWLVADLHVYLAATISVLIGLHILASLYHWYVPKDDVFERMLPDDALTRRALGSVDWIRR